MIKGSIQEQDFILVNIYASNTGAPKYRKQIPADIKGETDGHTIIVGDFDTLVTSMDRPSRQKISKATEILNDTTKQLGLISIFRILHFKKTHNTLSFHMHMAHSLGINHIQGHKISLKKFKSIEIISSIFSDHNGTKLEINHRKEEKSITWKLNMLLKNQWVNKEIKEEVF